MKLLLVSPIFPWPPDEGGRLRVLGLARELAASHELTLLAVARHAPDTESLQALRRTVGRLEVVVLPRGPLHRLRDLILSYLTRTPYLAVVYSRPALRRAVAALAPGHEAAQAEFPYGAALIADLPLLKVMDAHNVEADILAGNARHASSLPRRVHHRLQAAFMRRFERRTAARMDWVLACSEEDRRAFADLCPRTLTVPNAVADVRERDEPQGLEVLFTGLMSYLANAEGALWFVSRVWPLVLAGEPRARLLIVGKDPGPAVRALDGPTVRVTGRVEDVSGYYRQAAVFVCPLRVGSGTRLKILEAMSWGVPVVSTPLGRAGLEAVDGREIVTAEEEGDFARAVLSLLADPARRREMGRAGRELVASRFTWGRAAQTLNEKVYRTCA